MSYNSFQKNTAIWETIYKDGGAGSNLMYPCENLVVAASRYLSGVNVQGKRLLDIGSGSGNNLTFFARKGFDCFGIDVSPAAIEIARKRLSKEGLKAEIKRIEENRYPFKDAFFDIVVVWGVLSYNDENSLPEVLTEIKRVLKPGGVLLATFPTFKDFAVSHSKRIGKKTFELIHRESNQKGAIIIAAERKEDVRNVFGLFSDLQIGYSEIMVKDISNSKWIIYGTRQDT